MARHTRPHVAYHEAGHALIAYLLGRTCGPVTILPEGDSAGHAHGCTVATDENPEWCTGHKAERAAHDRTLFSLGGNAAIKVVYGRNDHIGASEDYGHAVDVALTICGGDPQEAYFYQRRLSLKARRMLAWKRPLLDALAAALMERETLTHRQVRELLDATQKRVSDEHLTAMQAKTKAAAQRPTARLR